MSSNLRSKTEIFLIGFEESQILGAKLPTIGQVLKTFFYNYCTVKLSVKKSAELTVQEVVIFWEKARIKMKREDHCAEKLLKWHKEWSNLKKNANRTTKTEEEKRDKFTGQLNSLFDIAHENAMSYLDSKGQQFLANQRNEERIGSIVGENKKQTQKEKRRAVRITKELDRKRKYEEQKERERNGKLIRYY